MKTKNFDLETNIIYPKIKYKLLNHFLLNLANVLSTILFNHSLRAILKANRILLLKIFLSCY